MNEKKTVVFENLHESEQMLLEEFKQMWERERRFTAFGSTPADGITRLVAQVGGMAHLYADKGDVVELHDEAVKLMALAYKFAMQSWED